MSHEQRRSGEGTRHVAGAAIDGAPDKTHTLRDGPCHIARAVLHQPAISLSDPEIVYAETVDQTIKRDIGRRIRRRREELGLSQWDLARRLDIRQDEVSRWENGRVHPTGHNLARIAEALECHWTLFAYGVERDPEATC